MERFAKYINNLYILNIWQYHSDLAIQCLLINTHISKKKSKDLGNKVRKVSIFCCTVLVNCVIIECMNDIIIGTSSILLVRNNTGSFCKIAMVIST